MIDEILKLKPDEAVKELEKKIGIDDKTIDRYINEYSGRHKILSKANKIIRNDSNLPDDDFSGLYPNETRTVVLDSETSTKESVVITAKNVFNLQKLITEYAVMFIFGSPVSIKKIDKNESTEEAFEAFRKLWKKTKCNSLNMKITRDMKIKTEAMEQWFYDKDKEKLRVGMFSYPTNLICPIFDAYGDLEAIVRQYTITKKNNKLRAYELLTEKEIVYYYPKEDSTGYEIETKPHGIDKIPAVYWMQEQPDWKDVQGLIDRLENSSSGHSDTNDYNVDPVLGIDGSVLNMPRKGDTGKMLQFDQTGDEKKRKISDMADFITWDQSIDSLKYEHELLAELINKVTFTPDITPDKIKGMGQISGVGIEMLFFNSILKAKRSWEENIKEYLERRASVMISFMKIMPEYAGLDFAKLELAFEMTSVLPKNITETINNLTSLRPGQNIASLQTVVSELPYEVNTKEEIEKLESENNSMGESFDI